MSSTEKIQLLFYQVKKERKIRPFKYENMKKTKHFVNDSSQPNNVVLIWPGMWNSSWKSPLSGEQGQSYSSEHAVSGKAGFIWETVSFGEKGEAGLQPKQITLDMRLKKHFKTRVQLLPVNYGTHSTKWVGSSQSPSVGNTYWRPNLFFWFKRLSQRQSNNAGISAWLPSFGRRIFFVLQVLTSKWNIPYSLFSFFFQHKRLKTPLMSHGVIPA